MKERNLNFLEIARRSEKHHTTVMKFIATGRASRETINAVLPVLGFKPKDVLLPEPRRKKSAA